MPASARTPGIAPVVAVAALSLAAALDWEARVHTYRQMTDFLEGILPAFQRPTSEREFLVLLAETENHLLGEVAHWAFRRPFQEPH